MATRDIISSILSILFLLFLQIVLVSNFVLFDVSFCYIYVAAVLFLPMDWKPIPLMATSFAIGILVDSFFDSTGIHAGACVLIAYLRPWIMKWMTPIQSYDNIVSYRELSLRWVFGFSFTQIIFHHFYLFWVDSSSLGSFGMMLVKIIASSIFTTIAIMLYRMLFFSPLNRE